MKTNLIVSLLAASVAVGTVACTASFQAGVNDPPPAATGAPVATVEAPPAPKPELKVEGGKLKLPGPVVFETGKDILKPESDPVLALVKDYLDSKPNLTLMRIEGHTDDVGDATKNQTLSEQRAMAVSRWLVGKGVACKRLIPVGFGPGKPIADNKTDDGKAQNRRTAFVTASLKGTPVAGMPVDGGGKVGGDPCK